MHSALFIQKNYKVIRKVNPIQDRFAKHKNLYTIYPFAGMYNRLGRLAALFGNAGGCT